MKKFIVLSMLIFFGFAETGCSGEAVISAQPVDVVYTHPASPGDGYIWVDGDWYWSGGTYVWRNGYWARGNGRTWEKGHWEHRPHGYYWHKGHWR